MYFLCVRKFATQVQRATKKKNFGFRLYRIWESISMEQVLYAYTCSPLGCMLAERVYSTKIFPQMYMFKKFLVNVPNHNASRSLVRTLNEERGSTIMYIYDCARSPDLTPCDYFLWGKLKSTVGIQNEYRTINDLKWKIKQPWDEHMSPDVCERAVRDYQRRLQKCKERV